MIIDPNFKTTVYMQRNIIVIIIVIIVIIVIIIVIIIMSEYFYIRKASLLYKYIQVKQTAINTYPE